MKAPRQGDTHACTVVSASSDINPKKHIQELIFLKYLQPNDLRGLPRFEFIFTLTLVRSRSTVIVVVEGSRCRFVPFLPVSRRRQPKTHAHRPVNKPNQSNLRRHLKIHRTADLESGGGGPGKDDDRQSGMSGDDHS